MRPIRFTALALGALLMAAPAAADDVEDALEAALEAYRAGDIKLAKEEVDYAAQLIAQQKAAGLGDFLPPAPEGWERRDDDSMQAANPFGGGSMANAVYSRGDERVEIQLMADNQMVASMAMMFGNAALMGQMGQLKRINRQKVIVTPDGELQAMIANRIFVMISGNAPAEQKEAFFEAIDLEGLEAF